LAVKENQLEEFAFEISIC